MPEPRSSPVLAGRVARVCVCLVSLLLADVAGAAAPVLRAVEFSGNSVFPDARLAALAQPWLGRPAEPGTVAALLARLTDLYLQAGFSTSRAVQAGAPGEDGVLRVTLVEGFLERIVVQGARAMEPSYVATRLQAGLTTPLNLAVLNANLRLLMQERGIADVKAELKPGSRPGASVFEVTITEAARFGGGMRLANDRAPAVGALHGAIEGQARDLFTPGDRVDVELGKADGLDDFDFRIDLPWSRRGPRFSLRYFHAVSNLVEEQFEVLGAETRSTAFDLGMSQALWDTPTRQLKLALNLVAKQSDSSLNGVPASFSPGVENGKADVRIARLSTAWTERRGHDAFSARLIWSAGAGVLGATRHGSDLPDGRFFSLFAQLQWLHALGPRLGSIRARAEAQLADDGLLPLEKFSVGGTNSVRGYRRSRYVRDNGWSAGLEYRLPLFRPATTGRRALGQVTAFLFVDAGRAWNNFRYSLDELDPSRTLVAAGPGLRWELATGTGLELAWGGLRRRVADTGDNLQDHGLHFMLSAHRQF